MQKTLDELIFNFIEKELMILEGEIIIDEAMINNDSGNILKDIQNKAEIMHSLKYKEGKFYAYSKILNIMNNYLENKVN